MDNLDQRFDNWKESPMTGAFLQLIDERIKYINELLLEADTILGPDLARARLLGQREVLEMIADLSLEDIKEHIDGIQDTSTRPPYIG